VENRPTQTSSLTSASNPRKCSAVIEASADAVVHVRLADRGHVDSSVGAADAWGACSVSKGRNREMVTDHQREVVAALVGALAPAGPMSLLPGCLQPATIAISMAIDRPQAIGDAPAGPERSGGWQRRDFLASR
jgi:hypothetical protein